MFTLAREAGGRPMDEGTERDRFWLRHHEAQVASGDTAKAYAAAHGISVQALYQSRKRLRALGLLPPGQATGSSSRARAGFSKVAVAPVPTIEPPRFRIELPNGAVLEWSGAASVGPVADLVERMARLP
jgi:hypothetical protein